MLELFKPNEIERLHELTLTVLAEHGVAMLNDECRELLKQRGAAVEGELVRLPRALVEAALKSAPSSFTVQGRNGQTLTVGGGSPTVYAPTVGSVFMADPIKGRRTPTAQDQIDLLKLSHTSPYCGLSCAGVVYPAEYGSHHGLLTQLYNALTLSDKIPLALSQDADISRHSIDMIRRISPDEGYTMIAILNSFSPLAWDEKMLGALLVYARAGQPVVLTCCSMIGLSSPMGVAETVVANNAEFLAGLVLAQSVCPGLPVVYGNTSSAVDMRTMGIALGSPEYAQLCAAFGQMARFYHLPYRSGGGLHDSKVVDAQAGAESLMNLLCAKEAGVDLMFHALGSMESFLTVSYEKWILDEESIGRIEKLFAPLPPAAADTTAWITEIGAQGNYLEHPSTFARFRELYRPPLANRENYDVWSARGGSLLADAGAICRRRLAEYEPPADAEDVKKALRGCLEP